MKSFEFSSQGEAQSAVDRLITTLQAKHDFPFTQDIWRSDKGCIKAIVHTERLAIYLKADAARRLVYDVWLRGTEIKEVSMDPLIALNGAKQQLKTHIERMTEKWEAIK